MADCFRSLMKCSQCLALVSVLTVLILGADVQAHCDLEDFNLTSLNSANYWSVAISNVDENCLIPRGYGAQDVTSCVVYFAACKRLPVGLCSTQVNSSTCQVVKINDNKTYYFNIGYYEEDHNFKPIDGEVQGFRTVLKGDIIDERATSCSHSNYTTLMDWRCDSEAHWNPSSNNVTQLTSNIAHVGSNDCSLTLQFNYSGACRQPVHPTLSPSQSIIFTNTPTMSGSPTATPPPHTTSEGITPVISDERQNKQLIAGVVILALICAILTVLLIISGGYIYKLGGLSVERQAHYGEL